MARTGREAFDRSYQNRVGQFSRQLLHDNSKELTQILKEQNLIQDNLHYFEIGSGGARNLWYIWKENNSIKLSCNDFWEKESKENMHVDIRENINFYEGDTEDVLSKLPTDINIDVLLSSDHLMHIPRVKGENILTLLLDKVQPKYIVLRERKKEFETPEEIAQSYPRNYHNYERLEEKYDLIFETTSHVTEFFIKIYKTK